VTAVSSFRLLSQSEEIARNQIIAKESWDGVFDQVIYFGSHEPLLASINTEFIKSEQFPTIDRMMVAASLSNDWACLINADIVVSPLLAKVVEDCKRNKIEAITSMRYEFEPGQDLERARVVDSGYDFFMSSPSHWAGAAKQVPSGYRIGHNRWDNWVLGYFNTVCRKRFVDVTSKRLIFHPKHGERKQPYHIQVPHDIYLEVGRPPFYKLP